MSNNVVDLRAYFECGGLPEIPTSTKSYTQDNLSTKSYTQDNLSTKSYTQDNLASIADALEANALRIESMCEQCESDLIAAYWFGSATVWRQVAKVLRTV